MTPSYHNQTKNFPLNKIVNKTEGSDDYLLRL